ncbi:MAG TPA: ribonuclease Z [Deltaproteobacteria bacterium]|nr:ribonuclease Z [Deltaproteobacteria bacterium]HIJ75981.1 ribonuclease Z [Deltaproteobacteria bacterium]
MKIKFIGVGEAFDEDFSNTSIWVQAADGLNKSSILLDCGFTAPPSFWKSCQDPDDLDAIWISHFHGDHFFGLPALLARFWEMKRRKPLVILGQRAIDKIALQTLELAYSSLQDRFAYDLRFQTVEPGEVVQAGGMTWRSAVNGHPQRDLAVHIETGGKSLFYSGDGLATDETLRLARGADLVIHEAYRLDTDTPGHGNVMNCIDFARRAKARSLALVHIERNERRRRRDDILRVSGEVNDFKVFMPEPGDQVEI